MILQRPLQVRKDTTACDGTLPRVTLRDVGIFFPVLPVRLHHCVCTIIHADALFVCVVVIRDTQQQEKD